MTNAFDAYRDSYEATVARSIAFSNLPHDFFLTAKADFLTNLVAEHFGPGHRPLLLDVGCGVGRIHPLLLPSVGMLAGTDPSAGAIGRAAADNPSVAYRVGDGLTIPWPDQAFDCAVAMCVMHHVAPAAWVAFVAEMRRVVISGGLIVLIEHNPWNPLTRLAVLRCPFDADATLFGARRARSLLVDVGCAHVVSRHFLLLPASGALPRRIEGWTARVPLGAQYAAFGVR
jgi:SAM-dependent methyltransferase